MSLKDELRLQELETENSNLKPALKEVYDKLNDKDVQIHKMELEVLIYPT